MSPFFAGVVVGAWAFGRVGYDTLYLPALLTGAMGLGYVACRPLIARAISGRSGRERRQ